MAENFTEGLYMMDWKAAVCVLWEAFHGEDLRGKQPEGVLGGSWLQRGAECCLLLMTLAVTPAGKGEMF